MATDLILVVNVKENGKHKLFQSPSLKYTDATKPIEKYFKKSEPLQVSKSK